MSTHTPPPHANVTILSTTHNNIADTQWHKYLNSLGDGDRLLWDAEQTYTNLVAQSGLLFSAEINVVVTDVEYGPPFNTTTQQLRGNDVSGYDWSARADLRIISILRKHSLSPLYVSKDVLLDLLSCENAGPSFFDMLFTLRKGDSLSEKGLTFWAPFRRSASSYEICYQFKYIEKNRHQQGSPWSERQVGVYHRFETGKGATLFLINASEDTRLQSRLQTLVSNESTAKSFREALLPHVLILNTYLDNWRWALQFYGEQCSSKENWILTAPLSHPSISFSKLQELRNDASKLIAAASILKATLSLITRLQKYAASLYDTTSILDADDLMQVEKADMRELRALRLKCEGYLEGVNVVQSRIEMAVGLLADSLDQQGQKTSNRIADLTYDLTRKSVGDNAIVKVVTVITLIYLPVQGVATFFGMNLSNFQEDTDTIHFAKDWWLFLAISIPLTAVTLGILLLAMRREQNSRKDRDN